MHLSHRANNLTFSQFTCVSAEIHVFSGRPDSSKVDPGMRGFFYTDGVPYGRGRGDPVLISNWLRRACAARVAVVGLSVCVSVCVCLSTLILTQQATRRPISDTSGFRTTRD